MAGFTKKKHLTMVDLIINHPQYSICMYIYIVYNIIYNIIYYYIYITIKYNECLLDTHPPMAVLQSTSPQRCWPAGLHLLQAKKAVAARGLAGVNQPNFKRSYNIYKLHIFQWIGLRENLQETMVFTIKYMAFL